MHTFTNTPHLTIGISVLAAASLFLSDPLVTPGIFTGGASKRGWIASASFSRWATKSGKACVHPKEWVGMMMSVNMLYCKRKHYIYNKIKVTRDSEELFFLLRSVTMHCSTKYSSMHNAISHILLWSCFLNNLSILLWELADLPLVHGQIWAQGERPWWSTSHPLLQHGGESMRVSHVHL